jgi:glycosyltransferase involved in cell wall biosynthesis
MHTVRAEMSTDSRDPPATTVGILVRTLNESELIGTCIETLLRQSTRHEVEILVVDSGSTDSTVEIAESQGVTVIHVRPGDFDYSKALNVGIEELHAELVVSLSAHAIPLDERWVETMTARFEDPSVAGVTCRQVPWPDAPWREVQRLRRTFGPARAIYSRDSREGLVFSNAASCVRRSVWLEERFTLPAAEDQEWAERVVAAGWKVIYEPDAPVYHSHAENPRAQARRLIDVNRVITGDQRRTLTRTLRDAAGLVYRDVSAILALDEPLRRKIAHIADLLCMVSFYVLDFSRAGTTAERRRRDS